MTEKYIPREKSAEPQTDRCPVCVALRAEIALLKAENERLRARITQYMWETNPTQWGA